MPEMTLLLDTPDDGHTELPDVTEQEMCLAAVIIQIGHSVRDTLKDYWTILEQFCTPFYKNMKCI
jgi:hypothetical protein